MNFFLFLTHWWNLQLTFLKYHERLWMNIGNSLVTKRISYDCYTKWLHEDTLDIKQNSKDNTLSLHILGRAQFNMLCNWICHHKIQNNFSFNTIFNLVPVTRTILPAHRSFPVYFECWLESQLLGPGGPNILRSRETHVVALL